MYHNMDKKFGEKREKLQSTGCLLGLKHGGRIGFTEHTVPHKFLVCFLLLRYLIVGGVYHASVFANNK